MSGNSGLKTAVREIKRRADLLELLREAGFKPMSNGRGGHAQGNCIFHPDSASPSLHVYPDGHARCFGACGRNYDAIDVYMHFHGGQWIDAVRSLADRYGVPLPPPTPDELIAIEKRRATEQLLEDVVRQAEEWLWDPKIGADALAYLRQRGLSDETIRRARLGYWPNGTSRSALVGDSKPYMLEQWAEAGLLATSKKDGRNYDALYGCVIFPYMERGRVVYLTGRGVTEKRHCKLTGVTAPALYRGMPMGRADNHVVLVEGESDVLTLQQAGIPAAGLPGVGSRHAEVVETILEDLCVERAVLMFDNDNAGVEATKKLGAMLGSRAWVCRPAYPSAGPEADAIKDPNAYLQVVRSENLVAMFFEAELTKAVTYLDWMLADIGEQDTITQGRRLLEELVPFLAGVNEIERAAMIDRACVDRKWLPRPMLKRQVDQEIRRRSGQQDETSSMVETTSSLLAERLAGEQGPFLALFLERTAREGTQVVLYSQKHGIPVSVSLAMPRQVVSALVPEIGDVEAWVQAQVPSIETRQVPAAVVRALSKLASGLRLRWDLQEVADGMHALGPKDNRVVVLVDSRLRAVRENGVWSKPASPILFERYLLTSKQRVHGWLPDTWTVEDANRPLRYTAQQAFEFIHEMVQAGWRFRDSEVDSQIVALLPFALTWSQVFPTKPLIHITAETQSGKSLLVQGFFAGKDQRLPIGLVPTAYYNPDPSSAGIIGAFSGSSRTIILDEFEKSEERGGNHIEAILRMMRTASTGDAARLRGTQDQGAREDSLSVACLAASIEPIGTRDADKNRWYRIELNKFREGENQDGPEKMVPKWCQDIDLDLNELRRSVVFGLVDRIDELRQAYSDIQHDLDLPGRGTIDDRWLGNIWPCLAVAKVLGLDYRSLHGQIVAAKAADFASIREDRKGNRLLNSLLYTPFEATTHNGVRDVRESTTLATMIELFVEGGCRDRLELPWLGIYVQRRDGDLLMWAHPETVTRSVLFKGSREFGAIDASGFAAVAKDCSRFVQNSADLWCDLTRAGKKRNQRMTLFCLESQEESV